MNLCFVEDEFEIRDSYRKIFSGNHFVHTFESAKSMLQRCKYGLAPDVVITDLKMPEMDGLQLLQSLHSNDTEVPVIIVSGYGKMQDIIKALDFGVHAFVEKPFIHDDLKEKIDSALQERKIRIQNKKIKILFNEMLDTQDQLIRLCTDRYVKAQNIIDEERIPLFTTPEDCRAFSRTLTEEIKLVSNIQRLTNEIRKLERQGNL